MALEIRQRLREGIDILELKGRLTAGPEAGALREQVSALSAAGTRNLCWICGGWITSTAPVWARW